MACAHITKTKPKIRKNLVYQFPFGVHKIDDGTYRINSAQFTYTRVSFRFRVWEIQSHFQIELADGI